MPDTRIRCSALPNWPDCKRRTAAQLFRDELRAAGYTLRDTLMNAGALVGIATHTAARIFTKAKMDGESTLRSDAHDVAFHEMRNTAAEGMLWDDVTRDRNTAEQQVLRMTAVYTGQVLPKIEPIAVEEELKAKLPGGYVLTGRKDSLARTPRALVDLKTGRNRRVAVAQYGGYSMLERSHRPDLPLEVLREPYIARAALTKPQPDADWLDFDVAPAEQEAMAIIEDIQASHDLYVERHVAGHPAPETAFMANPRSILCSNKWCTAWGTNFCRVHAGAKK